MRRMRLPYMRKVAPDVLATARAQRWDPAEVLRLLIAEEVTGRSVPSQAGDEAARELLDENHDDRAAKVDAWLARALADQSGHYADLQPVRPPSPPCPHRCAPAPRCSLLLPARAHR